jgi:LPPG:FO 2-phospho-L-lactate transferase
VRPGAAHRGRLLDSVAVNVTALAGGVGGAKLLVGLDRALGPGELTAIVNTGDDAVLYGVHVSPDIDIVTYWLAGIADFARGWGIEDDTFTVVESLAALGAESWFRLGDRDFATCLYRTLRLRDGAALSVVTDEIRRELGVSLRILPATDDELRTLVHTVEGRTLEFQQYFVRERQQPEVSAVTYSGSEESKPAPGVMDAIASADLIVLCPSNPVLSIGPVLTVNGVRDALKAHDNVVAVTPIVRGAALKGPADRILASMGFGSSAASVARLYSDFVDVFVVDSSDAGQADEIEAAGLRAKVLDTMMPDHGASHRLAEEILRA